MSKEGERERQRIDPEVMFSLFFITDTVIVIASIHFLMFLWKYFLGL
jgi:hypothetical protein